MWAERAQRRDQDADAAFWEDIRLESPWARGGWSIRPQHPLFPHTN